MGALGHVIDELCALKAITNEMFKMHDLIRDAQVAYASGNPIALFDALLLIAEAGGQMPDWISDNLARELVPLLPGLTTGIGGRGAKRIQVMRDGVKHLRRYRALEMARANKLKGDASHVYAQQVLERGGESASIETILTSHASVAAEIKAGRGIAKFWRPISPALKLETYREREQKVKPEPKDKKGGNK